jgi:hypothetical protein
VRNSALKKEPIRTQVEIFTNQLPDGSEEVGVNSIFAVKKGGIYFGKFDELDEFDNSVCFFELLSFGDGNGFGDYGIVKIKVLARAHLSDHGQEEFKKVEEDSWLQIGELHPCALKFTEVDDDGAISLIRNGSFDKAFEDLWL